MIERYRPNLWIWIDLEMTGLDITQDVILEIAMIITDTDLNLINNSTFSAALYQPDLILNTMNSWSKENHQKSGLTQAVKESKIVLKTAEEILCNLVLQYETKFTLKLCGNSIWQDRIFINKYMPTFAKKLHYRMIDISSIKEIIQNWYYNDPKAFFKKKESHRALDDIYESIAELRYYKKFFLSQYNDNEGANI